MVRRSARILFEAIAASVVAVAILFALLAWRLSENRPIHLRFLTPYLEQALAAPDGSFRIAIGDTLLTWAGWERGLDLRARAVEAYGAEGELVAAVPELAVSLSGRALLRGLVAPTALDIFGPRLSLVREPDGRLRFVRATAAGQPGEETSALMPALLGELLKPPDGSRVTGYITRARILGGEITFDDRRTGVVWRVPAADVELRRGPVGIAGTLSLAIAALGRPARLAADFTFDPRTERIALSAQVSDVDMSALGLIEPSLVALAGADIRIGGRLETTIGLDGSVGTTRFEAIGAAGALGLPGVIEAPLEVAAISIKGNLEAGLERLNLERAEIDFGGPRFGISGTVTEGENGALDVAGRLWGRDVPLAELRRYWPLIAAVDARRWVVDNIVAGRLGAVEADIALSLPQGDIARAQLGKAEVSLEASDMTIHYFRPLPPIEHVRATGRITDKSLTAEFAAGEAAGLVLHDGRLVIAGLDGPDQHYRVEVSLAGPFQDTLRLLDHKPLGYARKIGLDPATAAGTMTTELKIEFPNVPVRGTRAEDVTVAATARLDGVRLERALFGQPLSEGDLTVRVDNAGMLVEGTGRLAGAPARLRWTERFTGGGFGAQIAVSGTLEAKHRATLGLDLAPYLDGPVPTEALYTRYRDGRQRLDLKLDLGASDLHLPFLSWSKPAGEPGEARLGLDLENDRPRAIPQFEVRAGTLDARGRARFAPDGGAIAAVEFDDLKVGRTALKGVAADFAAGFVRVAIGEGVLDAAPLLEGDEDGAADDEDKQPFSLRADRLAQLYLGPERRLDDVSLALRHDGRYWDRIELKASMAGGGRLLADYQPAANGRHTLTVSASDAGAVLRAFDVLESVQGGELAITGEANDAAPERPLKGRAAITEFRLVRAPVLARLLSIATLTGLVDAFTGEGFLFHKFSGEFTKTGGLLEVPRARANGPSIGLTATGTVDFDGDRIDLQGTIVPAYAFNSILGYIPLIGPLLQGGEGEGLFAATYTATGPLDEPSISVNPLAALAPGFLRGVFEGRRSDDAEEDFIPLPRREDREGEN